jgi:hypothetical protein
LEPGLVLMQSNPVHKLDVEASILSNCQALGQAVLPSAVVGPRGAEIQGHCRKLLVGGGGTVETRTPFLVIATCD